MKRNILNIIFMLLTLSAAFSCTAAFVLDDKDGIAGVGELSLRITGTVSDINTLTPLEGVKITFSAKSAASEKDSKDTEMNVYTDNKGVYIIEAAGFHESITCTVTASDPDDVYSEASQEVEILWTGVSFDEMKEKFIVNDCNFKLDKK